MIGRNDKLLPGEIGEPRRLRDTAGPSPDPALARAAALVRALPAPRRLTPAADARVLRQLRQAAPTQARWVRRSLLQAASVAAIIGTGMGMAAALEWMRTPRLVAPPPAVAPHPPSPLVSPPARPAAGVALPGPAPTVVAAAVHDQGAPFVRARLAIDPRSPAFRAEVPPEFARAHAGQMVRWRLEVCVAADGRVLSAKVVRGVQAAIDREVARAVSTFRYHPAEKGGRAIRSCLPLSYEMRVEGRPGGPTPPSTP